MAVVDTDKGIYVPFEELLGFARSFLDREQKALDGTHSNMQENRLYSIHLPPRLSSLDSRKPCRDLTLLIESRGN